MGGSVVVRGCPILLEHKYSIGGVAVLDVVEGQNSHSYLCSLAYPNPLQALLLMHCLS